MSKIQIQKVDILAGKYKNNGERRSDKTKTQYRLAKVCF